MPTPIRHYGWECSPYSSKTRAYFAYKQIPHKDISPTLWTFKRIIEPTVGFLVMPIVALEDGTLLQDSSHIIDELEQRFPSPALEPTGTTQRLVSLLLELYSDEWLPIIAMHTRWNSDINRDFAVNEFGRCALPWLPRVISTKFTRPLAVKMASYRAVFGITHDTMSAIDDWLERLLTQLDTHFERYPYVLGNRPCLGDFSLYGPLYAHIWRDPGSRERIEPFQHVMSWLQRIRTPDGTVGSFLNDDAVPETLYPILTHLFHEQYPILRATVDALTTWLDLHPKGNRVPRGLGTWEVQIGQTRAPRTLMSYQQWQFQRPLSHYKSLDDDGKRRADDLLKQVGGLEAMRLEPKYRLKREGYRVVVDR